MNFRFALPGGAGSLYEPGSEGVLTWGRYADKTRNRPVASLLDRCAATTTCPKIIEAIGSTEFWGLWMSPGLIARTRRQTCPSRPPCDGSTTLVPPTAGRGGFTVDLPLGAGAGCSLPANPNPQAEQTRALTVALVVWVTKGIEPPASRYPLLHRGELVAATRAALEFPEVPQIPLVDHFVNAVLEYDFGPGFRANDLSGTISQQPPRIVRIIPTYVPKVDRDGNEIAGAASVLHQVPLATYLGWNVTASGFAKGRICGFNGGGCPLIGRRRSASRPAIHASPLKSAMARSRGMYAPFVSRPIAWSRSARCSGPTPIAPSSKRRTARCSRGRGQQSGEPCLGDSALWSGRQHSKMTTAAGRLDAEDRRRGMHGSWV